MSMARINHVMLMIWGVFAMHHLVKLLMICPSSRFNAAKLIGHFFLVEMMFSSFWILNKNKTKVEISTF